MKLDLNGLESASSLFHDLLRFFFFFPFPFCVECYTILTLTVLMDIV